jgi:hypothetical protein
MSIFDVVLKRRYTFAQIEEQLAAFDATTASMDARRAVLRQQIPTLAAREALGELSKEESKDLRTLRDEIAAILTDTRAETRAVLQRALETAAADEARARRVANIAEARSWQKKIDAASDAVVAALQSVTEKTEAMRQIEDEMPSFINEARSSVTPVIGGWLRHFRAHVEPDQIDHAIFALEGRKAILGQALQEIEAGAPSRAERRALTGLPA